MPSETYLSSKKWSHKSCDIKNQRYLDVCQKFIQLITLVGTAIIYYRSPYCSIKWDKKKRLIKKFSPLYSGSIDATDSKMTKTLKGCRRVWFDSLVLFIFQYNLFNECRVHNSADCREDGVGVCGAVGGGVAGGVVEEVLEELV